MRFASTLAVLLLATPAWAQVDLEPTSFEPLSTTVLAQSQLEYELEFTSVGYEGLVDLRVFTSTDAVFSDGDALVISETATASLGLTRVTLSGPHPGFLGEFDVFVVVDPDDAVTEDDESNNVAAATSRTRLLGYDLLIDRLIVQQSPPPVLGASRSVRVDYFNRGPSEESGISVEFAIRPAGLSEQVLLSRSNVDLTANDSETLSDVFIIPIDAPPGPAEFIARIVGPRPGLDEDPVNDVVVRMVELRDRFGDLTGSLDNAPGAAEAGLPFSVQPLIENGGFATLEAPSQAVIVLSADRVIERDDLEVGRASVPALTIGQLFNPVITARVPITVTSTTYWLGMILDAEDEVAETDEGNNAVLGPAFEVFDPDLAVVTSSLPVARLGVRYEAGLLGVGGIQERVWSIPSEQLPAGITLDGSSGILEGTPVEEGAFPLDVELRSGTARVVRPLELRVAPTTLPLRVASNTLPAALESAPYDVGLGATGGVEPYRWAAIDVLPPGLELGAAGRLTGVPTSTGTWAFDVEVTDDLDERARGRFRVTVFAEGSGVDLAGVELGAATIGVAYGPVQLVAAGMFTPFVFSSGEIPPGLSLTESGALQGVPTQVGGFSFVVNVRNQVGLLDSAFFTLQVQDDGALSVASTQLPDARVDEDYDFALSATGGAPPYAWSILGDQTLPLGLTLGAEGIISGRPRAANVFRFAARVVDSEGRTAQAPLEIRVERAGRLEDSGGCACATPDSGPPLALLWLLVPLWRVRSKRRVSRRS